MWLVFAAGSAFFAGLTSILAKCGIRKTDSTVATALRTIAVLIMAILMTMITGSWSGITDISGKTWLFLVLSGLATGGSWLCYFRALQLGDVNKVVPIDKSSTILTIVLAFLFLGEGITWLKGAAVVLIAIGTVLSLFEFSGPWALGGGITVCSMLPLVLICHRHGTKWGICSALVYGVLHLELSFSIVLSALASATAPASTMMTIRQTGAHGDFVDTLLQVVALDDVVGLILYSVAISVAMASQSGSMQLSTVIAPILANICVLALGALFGVMLKLFFRKRSTDNRLIVSIATLFAFCGICAMADISPLLGCMSMGMTYINLTGDEKLFRQLGYWSPPILLLFFVRSGLSFNLGALTDTLGASGSVPLLLVGILYFAGRIVGKYAGAYLGALAVGKGKGVRNYLGLALIPQAGVAIGLAAMGARTLGGEMGEMLQTIILASSVLYELVGPGCSKLALFLSGSYGHDVPDAPRVAPAVPKSRLETLIERMKAIEARLPDPVETSAEEELAFTQAAQEQYDLAQYYHNRRFKGGRSTGGIHP